jgi:hypothetical protein
MSSIFAISEQWTCLTEPERLIAHYMANTGVPASFYIGQAAADALFEDVRGGAWQVYRDIWLANWLISIETVNIGGIDVSAYITVSDWPLGVALCEGDDECGEVTTRCRPATGF